jgi:predicted amidohydrolase YtcJ
MNKLFRGGKIWVKHGVWVEALAVQGQRILAVGNIDQVTAALNKQFDVIDLEGGMLVPGFHDGHLHLIMGGFSLMQLLLDGIYDRSRALDMISQKSSEASSHPGKDPWLLGIGYDENRLHLTKQDINRLCPHLPAMIRTRDLHSALVNDLALQRAGITAQTPDPAEGKIERNPNGNLTGILREAAVDLVDSLVPLPDQSLSLQAIQRAQEDALRLGITSISDSIRVKNLPAYEEFHNSGHRKIRINGWRNLEDWNVEDLPLNPKPNLGFQVRTLKGFVDGAMGSDTAWLMEDFLHRPGYRGIGMIEESELTELVRRANQIGYRLALHAIGDRANHVALNAFQHAAATPQQRHRIEHAQLLMSSDIPRFGSLGIIASVQPIHCTDDMEWKIKKIGHQRAKNAYAWKSLWETGARMVFGSDWPVANYNPMEGLRAAVTRRGANGTPEHGWNPEQTLPLETALDIYTGGGAYAAEWESDLGTLEPGKLADIVLLDKNLFDMHPLEFPNVKVLGTWVQGKRVYSS